SVPFLFSRSLASRVLHSFPTRRSSDLVLLTWAARQRDWAYSRTALPPVLSIAILLLAATLVHLDRFHHDLYGRFWLAFYAIVPRSEEHTSELQSPYDLVCRLLLEKKNN